jgi:hypothetical protein
MLYCSDLGRGWRQGTGDWGKGERQVKKIVYRVGLGGYNTGFVILDGKYRSDNGEEEDSS